MLHDKNNWMFDSLSIPKRQKTKEILFVICEYGAEDNLYNTVKEELEACTYSKCSVSDPVYGEISSVFFFVGHCCLLAFLYQGSGSIDPIESGSEHSPGFPSLASWERDWTMDIRNIYKKKVRKWKSSFLNCEANFSLSRKGYLPYPKRVIFSGSKPLQ